MPIDRLESRQWAHGPLIVVRIDSWALVVEEVSCIKLRVDGLERDRCLVEVETVGKIVGAGIRVAERWQAEGLLDEVQYASEIMVDMGDIPGLGVGRDYDQRHAKSIDVA